MIITPVQCDIMQLQFIQQNIGDVENLIQLAPVEYWQKLVTAERYTPKPDGEVWPRFLSHADCSLVRG